MDPKCPVRVVDTPPRKKPQSLVFQSFSIIEEAIQSMLVAIEEMKFFLRTAYGFLKDFAGSTIEVKFQRL